MTTSDLVKPLGLYQINMKISNVPAERLEMQGVRYSKQKSSKEEARKDLQKLQDVLPLKRV